MKRRLFALLMSVIMTILFLVGCGDNASNGSAQDGADDGVYKIALSNSYMENGWRQEMEAIAEMVAATDEYKAKCVLDIYNTDNTVEAQVASLESLLEMDYDAIIIDCCVQRAD